jgi:hypothetical protein
MLKQKELKKSIKEAENMQKMNKAESSCLIGSVSRQRRGVFCYNREVNLE